MTGKEYLKKHIGKTNIPEEHYENEIGEMMEWYADDYHKERVKNLSLSSVVSSAKTCDCGSAEYNFSKKIGCKECC